MSLSPNPELEKGFSLGFCNYVHKMLSASQLGREYDIDMFTLKYRKTLNILQRTKDKGFHSDFAIVSTKCCLLLNLAKSQNYLMIKHCAVHFARGS